MMDFDGAALMPTEAYSAYIPTTSLEGTGIGAAFPSGSSADPVLQEASGGTGDEWIAQLMSMASSDALATGMMMPGGDVPLTLNSGDGDDQEIVITGPRLYYNGELGGGGDPSGDNTGTGGGGGEGGSGGSGAVAVGQHEQDCGTEDGAAVQVANKVKARSRPACPGHLPP